MKRRDGQKKNEDCSHICVFELFGSSMPDDLAGNRSILGAGVFASGHYLFHSDTAGLQPRKGNCLSGQEKIAL